MKEYYVYKAFGLIVKSEIVLPELIHASEDSKQDVTIKIGDLYREWEQQAQKQEQYFSITASQILFRIPNVAIFSMKSGIEITVSPDQNQKSIPNGLLRLYLLGTCMEAILLQRNILPLHGSAIVFNNEAYAIVGESGAGKSTLASAFVQKGCQLLSDDVIPVTMGSNGEVLVTPAYPQQKLWMESLQQFQINYQHFTPLVERREKYAIPVTSHFSDDVKPLVGIIELVKSGNQRVNIKPIHSLEKLQTMFSHTYRNFLLAPLGMTDWHFNISAQILNQITMTRLTRPNDSFTAFELSEVIFDYYEQGELVK
ncbi:hypothetical protein [Alkalihalobacillus trypoxylicola]|uniref:Aldolase n=1 Tax=Alkalihalobacillus trypoxylicola TaxID=519424 RepID=A0A161P9D1_9BACI|nr:hypothetical protein [Alkalihalobacillus trypoxylicola]KYG27650.1 hypothetical protein AZF04_10685 [Alkalihalobacillus trypoxylicola]